MKFSKYIKTKNLKQLFDKKIKDTYSMGTDGITVEKFSEILDDEIVIIRRKIKNQTYNVSPYKEKLILKGKDSKPRAISIPTNRDRLAFSALTAFITDNFRKKIVQSSIHTKILDIKNNIKSNKYDSFIKIDIKNYYPSINHDILFKKLKKQINDEMALSLLKKAITKYTIPNGKISSKNRAENTKGIPQGLSFSNILSMIYLTKIDKKHSKSNKYAYYRFVDDILILCNKEDTKKIKTKIIKDIQKLGLEIHEFKLDNKKSIIGNIKEDGFQFLGYKFFDNKVSVRESSVDKIKNHIV